jgi:hypothetical protein
MKSRKGKEDKTKKKISKMRETMARMGMTCNM